MLRSVGEIGAAKRSIGMRASRFLCLALVISIFGTTWAQSASADPAEAIYDPSTVVFIDLTLTPTEEAKLEAKSDKYVKGTFALTKTSDGTPAGKEPAPLSPPRPVEIRLKGSTGGSFRKLTGKAAFKLKFKEADAFLGLRKMTLNNMVQDPSMVHETLAYAAFRSAGIPASRTGFAYVRLNGEDFGLYLNLENLDKIALEKIFGSFDDSVQHLYEGEGGHDVTPGSELDFEADEGDEEKRGDLEALIAAVNGGGSDPWSMRVSANADLAEMTKMWAVEKYIDHWDGYSGHAEAGLRPNNYYLYSDPTGKFQMLPWGTDQTWIPTIGVGTPQREVTFDGHGGLLFDKCLADSECFRSYWEALQGVTGTVANLDPAALAEETADLLAPWQAEEQKHPRAEHDANEVEDGVDETLEFIAGRTGEAEEWLDENTPPPKPTPPAPTSSRPTSPTPSSATPTSPLLFFLRSTQSARFLAARLWLIGPGFVSVKAKMTTPEGEKVICADHTHSDRLGPVMLHCKLSAAALQIRSQRVLPLKLQMYLALDDGRTETIIRRIRLPRG
jgi:hypothetical protein